MATKLQNLWRALGKHKCLCLTIFFVLLICFIDENSLLRRWRLIRQNNELQEQILRYEKEYADANAELKQLDNSPEAVERVARVNLLMKTSDEDVYVIEETP